ncbi:MAG: hypothetical protein RIR00_646 [Pseudomonadota bacterium]|jgi:hypothetical protein
MQQGTAMADVILALGRSMRSLLQTRVWGWVLAPALLAFALWLVLAWWGLSTVADNMLALPPLNWLAAWGAVWLAHLLAYLGGWMVLFALIYLTTALLAAVFVLPWLLRLVAERDYPELALMGKDAWLAGLGNSLWAMLVFVLSWLFCLPLWLVPGLGIVVPMLLLAGFNRRTFAYDALANHATPAEWQEIRAQQGRPLFWLGLVLAGLAHVPLIGLLVPTLSVLAYIHFCLEALRRLRGGAVVTLEAL